MASSQRAAGAVSSGRPEATGPRPVDVRAVRVGPLPSRLPCDCRRVEHGGGARSPRGHAEAHGELAGLSSGPRLVPGLPCLHPVRPSALGAAHWRPCKKQHPETQPEGACLPALGHPRAGTSSYFRVFVSRGAAFTGAGGCPVLSVGGPAPPHNEPSRGGCRPQDPPLGLDSGPLLHSEPRGQPPAWATWQRPGSCPSGGPGGGGLPVASPGTLCSLCSELRPLPDPACHREGQLRQGEAGGPGGRLAAGRAPLPPGLLAGPWVRFPPRGLVTQASEGLWAKLTSARASRPRPSGACSAAGAKGRRHGHLREPAPGAQGAASGPACPCVRSAGLTSWSLPCDIYRRGSP